MDARRVVTGWANGKSVFVSDDDAPRGHDFVHTPGYAVRVIWATDGSESTPPNGDDPTAVTASYVPGAGGTRLLFMQLPPDSAMAGQDPQAAGAEFLEHLPGLADVFEADGSGFHATPTVDYVVLLTGSLILELDDGAEREVHAGDVIVQNATRHVWHNRSEQPATLAAFLVGLPSA